MTAYTLTRLSPVDGDTILPLASAKSHLRVLHNDEDADIASMRDEAIDHVERESGVALTPTQYRWVMPSFPSRIYLPIAPVTAVIAASYYDGDGVEQIYAGARLVGGSVIPAINGRWPTAYDYAAVEFTAGLSSPSAAPALLSAVKLMLGHLYEQRGGVNVGNIVTEVPLGVQALIDDYRAVLV